MKFLVMLLICMVVPQAFAKDGAGNGGDPMTAQFIIMAKQLAVFYKENPFNLTLPFKPEDFSHRVEILEASIKSPDKRHLVEFTGGKLFDHNKVEKPAIYEDQKPVDQAQIRVNRLSWSKFSNQQRLVQINLEIMGIMKIPNRYQLAQNLIRDHVAVIVSIPLPDDIGYHKPGWRIVGQNPDQFGYVTTEDYIIDGGSLGLGSEINKRIENFLVDSKEEKAQWLSGIMTAWKNGRPGFLLLNTPDGNNASITAFFPSSTENEFILNAYSLVFTKFRQIYSGPCADDAHTLTAVERLKNCYLDSSNYWAQDTLISQGMSPHSDDDQSFAGMKSLTSDLHDDLLAFTPTTKKTCLWR